MALNQDFQQTSRDKWNELIAKALKINSLADFEAKKIEGVVIPSFNHPTDKIEVNNPLINIHSDWKIATSINTDEDQAHSHIMNGLQNGVQAINLKGKNPDWNSLFDGVFHEMLYTDIETTHCADAISSFVDYCLLYTSPSPRDQRGSRMPSSA